MEELKIFRIIQRINSVLFLLLLMGALGFIVFLSLQSKQWQQRNTVEVNETDLSDHKIELRMGRLHEVYGHDVHYVELYSEGSGGKFSSYTPKKTRNILFFIGDELKSHWLFETQSNLISNISLLTMDIQKDKKEPVIAFAINLIKSDTNGDGVLSDKDSKVIALISPDGSHYTEIEKEITEVIDTKVVNDGKVLMLLVQVNANLVMKKYSLIDFRKISEKTLLGIGQKL